VTVISGPPEALGAQAIVGGEGDSVPEPPWLVERAVAELVAGAMAKGTSGRGEVIVAGETLDLFVDVTTSPPSLVMVGGVHIAVALSAMARAAGFRTIVVDPRRAFGSRDRFPDVDLLIQEWPDAAFAKIDLTPTTAVAILTHDPKIDDPALKQAIQGPAFYVGALGSVSTHKARRQRLQKAGIEPAQLDRIHAPIGLDINAQTPEEIAVSIMAEIVLARRS
jgi:xanthine dehydrogenase accessory factor